MSSLSAPLRPTRGFARVLWAFLLTVGLLAGSVAPAGAARERQDFEWIAEQVLLGLHNQGRQQSGVASLAEYRDIREVARAWSDQLASDGDIAHNPNYGTQICCAKGLAENVGQRLIGSTLTESAVRGAAADLHRAFMESPSHRDNVLGPYAQVGAGVSLILRDGYWRMYATVNFRSPDGSEPTSGLPSSRPIDDTCGAAARSTFSDVPGSSPHSATIACIENAGIASGKGDGTFGAKELVTRGQVATFLMRTLNAAGVATPPGRPCTDGQHSVGMSAMLEWGLAYDDSCDATVLVTRTQMARWSVRALTGPLGRAAPQVDWDYFTDDNHLTSASQDVNNAIAEWGVVTGVGNDKFLPLNYLRRDQMATFLARLLDAAVEGR